MRGWRGSAISPRPTICRSQVSSPFHLIVNTLEADIINLQKQNQELEESLKKAHDKQKDTSKKVSSEGKDLDDISGRLYKLEEKLNLLASNET